MTSPHRTAIAAVLLVLLAGCAGGSEDAESPTTPPTTTQTAQETSGDTSCLLGRWYLDTEQYAAQSVDFLTSLGVPISALNIAGNQILDFNESPYMNIATDLQLDAVVGGQAVSVSSQSAGGGEWGWDADSETDIGVDNWEWTVEPGATPDGSPPLLDPSQGIAVTCSADQLTVQGAGAPLTGTFVRR